MKKQIPQEVQDALDAAAKKYADSKATTNAGRVLRFLSRFVSVNTVLKIFAHKLS